VHDAAGKADHCGAEITPDQMAKLLAGARL
jgi:hypothetical protein